jgi:hypothetical protein
VKEQTEQAVLQYLNDDAKETLRFQSLTTIFEKVVKPGQPRADAYDFDDEIESKEELRVLLDQLVQDGLLESSRGERDYEASYRLTEQGVYEASGFDQLVAETPRNAILTEAGETLMTEDGHFIIMENGIEDAPPETSVDSHDWTGIAAKIDAAKLAEVQNQVSALLLTIDQSACDDRTRKNARKHAEAIVALLEAPDPPWKVIVELLNNPVFTAFLNTATVLSLIFGT